MLHKKVLLPLQYAQVNCSKYLHFFVSNAMVKHTSINDCLYYQFIFVSLQYQAHFEEKYIFIPYTTNLINDSK